MAAAPDPKEVLGSTSGKANFQRVARLLISGGTTLLREIFDLRCPPSNLPSILKNPATVKQLKAAKLTKPQWDCLYPSPGVYGKSEDFSMILLFRLLRTICNLTPTARGWHSLPTSTDHSLAADLTRIQYYRNSVYGHPNPHMEITDYEFSLLWEEISTALVRIAGHISQARKHEWQMAIDKLLEEPEIKKSFEAAILDQSRDLKEQIQDLNRKVTALKDEGLNTNLREKMLRTLQQTQHNASEDNSKTELLAELKTFATDKGFVISDNQGSGDCLFYALSEQLNLVKRIKISHKELRQSLVQFLWKNPQLLDGTDLLNFVDGYQTWADYLTNMERNGTWGDHVILYAAANCYQTCIRVISSLSPFDDLIIRPNRLDVDSSNPLVLGHVHELHYVSLQPVQEAPFEIRSQGRSALEAYNKALVEGSTTVKRMPIMLVGQHRTGKTSLKNSLIGKRFNRHEDSTVGIDVDPSYFKVSTEIWKTGKKDQPPNSEKAISYENRVAQLTVQNLRASLDVPSANSHEFTDDVGDLQSSEKTPDPESIEVSREPESLHSNYHPDASANKPANPTLTPFFNMTDDIANIIAKLLEEGEKVENEDDIYSVLWDFGGQSVFYATHPLFLTVKAIYILMFDLSQDPDKRSEDPVVKQGMFTSFEDSSNLKTNLDYLDFWMNSIASLGTQEEISQESPNSETLPEKLPPVFLVCTHADTPFGGGDPCVLARKVFGYLQTKPYANQLFDDVFAVDNTKSGHGLECTEVVRLRNDILVVAKELPQMKEHIPVKWLKFEKALQDMKQNGYKCITLENAKQIASEGCNIVEDEQFRTLVNFLHDQRILIHFNDTEGLNKLVILDPQWLINVFKMVITIRPYHRKEKAFKELWTKLEKTGILEEKLLEHVWKPIFETSERKEETIQSLLAIMEKFSLLCPWPSSNASGSKQYLVPSMLMSPTPEDVLKLVSSAQIPSLFIKFESGQVPPGLFPRLVLQFFEWGKDGFWSQVNPQLYHSFARFYTSGDKNCSVILICHSSSVQVVVHKGSRSVEVLEGLLPKMTLSADVHHASFDETCARDVCRQLGLMLESMRKEFCWLNNMKYELSVICPICCQGGAVSHGHCRWHHTQGCKQEECLHFWSLSELCNAEEEIFCNEPGSAFAEIKKVEVQQFAPWFVSFGEQGSPLAIDGNHSKYLANVEGNEETTLSLPGEVEESLSSRSCDASEVVLQLKECLQLDQVCLEQPGPGTESLIRCLVRKAKRLDRLDVVKHLREITPAGTTGPLLEERLDVRHIPIRQRRELTIALSGGHEWKEVAEELGLTPPEIRYLDHRTLNPCDAVLAFIANQRYISVGQLYDLLSKCGYPVLADVL